MTFVIVTVRMKKNIKCSNDILQRPRGTGLSPRGGIVSSGSNGRILDDVGTFIALVFKQVKRASGRIGFI